MKKDIGSVVALYPTPTTVVGAIVDGKVNWLNIAHIGIVGLDAVMISSNKSHFTNWGIKENRKLSINLVSEEMLKAADYVGLVSGINTDKSDVFKYHMGELNVPIIDISPLSMECEVIDIYNYKNYENFILKIAHTHVEEELLDENGKINYEMLKPILFEMPTQNYLRTGEVIAKCWSIGKEFQK